MPLLCTNGLWTRRGLYRVTSDVTRDLGFWGLISRTTTSSSLILQARKRRDYSNPDHLGVKSKNIWTICKWSCNHPLDHAILYYIVQIVLFVPIWLSAKARRNWINFQYPVQRRDRYQIKISGEFCTRRPLSINDKMRPTLKSNWHYKTKMILVLISVLIS